MKVVVFSDEARNKLKNGVDLIANAVKVTLGPRGRNFVYGFHYGYPVCTKDGVTVARQVEAKDQTEQLGLLLVRQVAQKTADDAGDGTTTATLLAQEIFTEGLKTMQSGANPILIKRGIDKAVEEAITYIDSIKKNVESDNNIVHVASLSANNDPKIGNIIKQAIDKVGKDGIITIEDNYQATETELTMMEGMQLMEGLVSPYFITDPVRMEAYQGNPYLIIIDGDIHNVNQVAGILEKSLKTGRPVCVMANSVHGTVLQNLVQSKMKNNLQLVVVKSPYFGDFRSEQLQDIAILTGATVIGHITGLRPEDASLDHLGQCESIKASRYSTTIVNGQGDKMSIDGRIASIKTMIEKSESDYDREKLRERMSKLTNGVAVIKVGAPTEVEQKEKKMRIEDALLATKAALEDGIVPGGGVTLLLASYEIKETGDEEEMIGRRIIKKALRSPIRQIALNAGVEGSEIIAQLHAVKSSNYGYDFLHNKYGDMFEMGIIDPTKVVKTALINAASVAGMLLTTEAICNEEDELEVTRTPKPRSA
jgi:chaperonin GroEL